MSSVRISLLVLLFVLPAVVLGQAPSTLFDGTEGELLQRYKRDSTRHKRMIRWNEYDFSFTTFRIGGGVLYEYAGFHQDTDSKEQVNLTSQFKVRDMRFVLSGKFKTKRDITWKVGIMYDGTSKSYFIRESGALINLPEIAGKVFIGRTKEGYSLSKVMNGYSIWHMERSMSIDVIPILADGIKYLGFLSKQRLLWNAGVYTDWLSKGQSFSTYQWQTDARVAYLPIYSDAQKPVLHIGVNYRYGVPVDHALRVRSRPEANPAPYFVETPVFQVSSSNHIGGELYYRKGAVLFGSEVNWHLMKSDTTHNPVFFGGEAFMAYAFTKEVRPYLAETGIFTFLKVKKSVFKGGPGAWEGILRFSSLNLNSGTIKGGSFWRLTPGINWYLSDNFRLVVEYGYGVLDRYDRKGVTQFFQSRILFIL